MFSTYTASFLKEAVNAAKKLADEPNPLEIGSVEWMVTFTETFIFWFLFLKNCYLKISNKSLSALLTS